MEIILDANCMEDKDSAHEYLMKELELPSWYGKNLDALYDCITDMDHPAFRVVNYKEKGTYLESVLEVFQAAGVSMYVERG